MLTINSNIELITFDQLNDQLAKATSKTETTALLNQYDCDESLLYARVSLLEDDRGNTSGFVQVDGRAALIKEYKPSHVKVAVWMIEERA